MKIKHNIRDFMVSKLITFTPDTLIGFAINNDNNPNINNLNNRFIVNLFHFGINLYNATYS